MRYTLATLVISLVLPLLGGCGQMGPLYMPEDEPQRHKSAIPADKTPQDTDAS